MFIYNVTTQVLWGIHEEWVQWMVQQYILKVLATGCFVKHQMVRLLEADETEGPIYAVQYFFTAKSDYTKYIEQHDTILLNESFKKWGDSFIAFKSLMEVVN
jgi:hypothetical protein